MNLKIDNQTAVTVSNLLRSPKLLLKLTDNDPREVWSGINLMQDFLTEKNASRYLNNLPHGINSTPLERVQSFLRTY